MKNFLELAIIRCLQVFRGLTAGLRPGVLSLLVLIGSAVSAQAQQRRAPLLFQDDAAARSAAAQSPLAASLRQARPLTVDAMGLQAALATAPLESQAGVAPLLFALPLPDGTTGHFEVVESPVMEPGLAVQFPNIKTYSGVGVDDPTATIRLDVTPLGFHAQVLSANGTVYIDPVSRTDPAHYLSFYHKDMAVSPWNCGVSTPSGSSVAQRGGVAAQRTVGTTLRTFRLAVAADGEYTAFHGGTVAAGQAAIVTSVNRVVGVYETELAVRLVLVANNNLIVYTNAATDPYTNNNASALLGENQANIDARIGSANYDIGHVFTTGGGGLAGLGVVCRAGNKARGETGSGNPVGDAYNIDYVAHEMGHQFGGNHTFNSSTSNCGGGNRAAAHAYEPGSGSTIMAYAGICGADDLQPHSDPFFHVESFEEIQAYLGTVSCGTSTATGNAAPVITALPTNGKVLPIGTPFKLTASATDANGNALTYNWEEYDLGASVTLTAAQVALQTPPIFRSFAPTTSGTRYFPRLANILANTSTTSEKLPTVTRNLNFRVTVRDNRRGVNSSTILRVSTTSSAGPFVVTAPNTAVTWTSSSTQTVTWNVANTTAAPVSCPLVNLRLSTDGGLTYPTLLATNTPNDGSQAITVPNLITNTARVMVEAANNHFFDISNTNFIIRAPVTAVSSLRTGFNPTNAASVGFRVTFSGSITGLTTSNFAVLRTGTVAGTSIASVAGSGSIYTVTVNTGTGSGTVQLQLSNRTGLVPLVSNVPFVGQLYTIDRTGPVVTSVSGPANGFYTAGQNLNFTVNFNEAATVTTLGGIPSLGVVVGATSRQATYVSGSGSTALTFRYTVAASELDTNGVTLAAALALNGGTIRDALANNASLTLNGVASTTGVLVDAINPTVAISSAASPSTGAIPIPVAVVFSEPVTGFGITDVTVTNGVASGLSGSGSSYALSVTPTAAGPITLNMAANQAQDVAGNGNVAAPAFSIVFVPGSVQVLHQNDEQPGQPGDSGIRPNLQVVNSGPVAIPYSQLTLRYWLTVENFSPLTTSVNWAALGTSLVQAQYVALPAPRAGALGYVEYSFLPGAGLLAPGAGSGVILSSFNKRDWTGFDETDDYSFAPNSTYLPTTRITAYRNGILIGGVEPAAAPGGSQLAVFAENQTAAATALVVATVAQVHNLSNLPVPYADLAVRYWFTPDGPSPVVGSMDYAALGNPNVTLTTGQQGTQSYAELRFAAGLGALAPLSSSGDVIFRLHNADWSALNQANDYSYRPAAPLAAHPQMTVYRLGLLVYGTEPAGTRPAAARPALAATPDVARAAFLETYPNPFSAAVRLAFALSLPGAYTLAVYDGQGRLVETLATGQAVAGEQQHLTWEATGRAAGLYLVRLTMPGGVRQLKLVKL